MIEIWIEHDNGTNGETWGFSDEYVECEEDIITILNEYLNRGINVVAVY